ADAVEHGNRRHVERELQGLAHRDGAFETEIKIFWRVTAITYRAIFDQRLRMDEAILETEAIDEGLERRAGRPQRLRHVDLPGAAHVEKRGRADMRQNLAAGTIDRENGERDVGTERRFERAEPIARELLKFALQIAVDGQPQHPLGRRLGDGL